MNPILQGLQEGYGEEEILSFLTKAIPQLGNSIKKATRSGYKTSQILGFLSKNFDTESLKGKSESQIHAVNRRADSERAKYGLKAAATAVVAPIAANAARSAVSRALPDSLKNLSPSLMQQNQSPSSSISPDANNPLNTALEPTSQLPQGQTNPTVSQQPPVNQVEPTLPQPVNIQQSEEKTNITDVLWNDLEKNSGKKFGFESDAFLKIARRMKSTGEIRSKEDFQRLFQLFEQKKNEGKDLPSALRESSQEFDMERLTPEKQLLKNEKLVDEGVKEPATAPEPVKIEKKSLVNSPLGLGEVKEIRNGQAIVEVDGKLHKVKEEDLESSPIPEKDLADLYDELIGGIEGETGEDVSRMVQWAGYNPETNTLQFLPHTGKLYKYGNISPEDAALLTDILSVRKTSGSNFIGAWKKDSKSPIGAALSKLIRKLQSERGGKGNEYEETHEPIYSAYEPAIEAKKEKLRKKKKK
jgi:hypothetical protein